MTSKIIPIRSKIHWIFFAVAVSITGYFAYEMFFIRGVPLLDASLSVGILGATLMIVFRLMRKHDSEHEIAKADQ